MDNKATIDISKLPSHINPEDMEAVSEWMLKQHGVIFGNASSIYTERQLDRLARDRKECSMDSLIEDVIADIRYTSSQETLDRALDDLYAGKALGVIDQTQSDILTMLIKGFTLREIAEAMGMALSTLHDEVKTVRKRVQRDNSPVWIWLMLAEVFRQSVCCVREDLHTAN